MPDEANLKSWKAVHQSAKTLATTKEKRIQANCSSLPPQWKFMNARSLIASLAGQLHLSIDRKPPALLKRPDRELKPNLELAAAQLALKREKVFAVQVGANDGSLGDPLFQSVTRFAWSALMLEPQPEVFNQLRENYRAFPNVICANAAIADHDGTQTLYRVDSKLKEPAWASGLASFDINHILKHESHIPNVRKHLQEIEVPCKTFDTLFAEHGVGKVEVLQIDTEGFDAQVLRLFDVPRRLPAIINFEHKHLSMQDWNTAVQMLIDCDYLVAKTGQDTLACRLP